MTVSELTPAQLRQRGYEALLRELGPIGFVRFVQQFEAGQGDYTRDRATWLDPMTPAQIDQLLDERSRRGA